MVTYRGYKIERGWITRSGPPQPDEWNFGHPDYDGPGDPRAGYGPSLLDCKEQIDEIIEDELDR